MASGWSPVCKSEFWRAELIALREQPSEWALVTRVDGAFSSVPKSWQVHRPECVKGGDWRKAPKMLWELPSPPAEHQHCGPEVAVCTTKVKLDKSFFQINESWQEATRNNSRVEGGWSQLAFLPALPDEHEAPVPLPHPECSPSAFLFREGNAPQSPQVTPSLVQINKDGPYSHRTIKRKDWAR